LVIGKVIFPRLFEVRQAINISEMTACSDNFPLLPHESGSILKNEKPDPAGPDRVFEIGCRREQSPLA
jgi:hypothetical protein